MDIIEKAKQFAINEHGDQKYGDKPYSYHLERVAGAAWMFTQDPVAVAVAWLHDTIEDTDVTFRDLKREFGDTIAYAVKCLTDAKGKNRMERHLNTYPFIRDNYIALRVKLCDRLCNMQESVGKPIGDMYIREYVSFKYCFFEPNLHIGLWSAMDAVYEELKENRV